MTQELPRTLCLGLAVVTAACAKPRTPGVTDKEIVFGITAPLSGSAAAWGSLSAGAEAWAAHVNAQGGIPFR